MWLWAIFLTSERAYNLDAKCNLAFVSFSSKLHRWINGCICFCAKHRICLANRHRQRKAPIESTHQNDLEISRKNIKLKEDPWWWFWHSEPCLNSQNRVDCMAKATKYQLTKAYWCKKPLLILPLIKPHKWKSAYGHKHLNNLLCKSSQNFL